MNATTQIIDALNSAMFGFDGEMLAKEIEWARGRKIALKEYMTTEDYTANIRSINTCGAVYAKMHSICGGKGWYDLLRSAGDAQIVEFCGKNSAARAAKRNAKIAKDLAKHGITEVISADVARTTDGFDGKFEVMTDKGAKTVTITTIVAGGYNVQCLHNRVIVKVA